MSVSSASCVAGGAAGAGPRVGPGMAGADIIDLDRYMRASVRPSRHTHNHAYTRERLVVDAGGADLVPWGSVTSSSSGRPSISATKTHTPRAQHYNKRFSHDSGLSEDTYGKTHKLHRRIVDKYPESRRKATSNSSERDFRASCERALREQQEQIARVAAICEKLVQPQVIQNDAQDAMNTPNGYMPQLVLNVDHKLNYPSQNMNKVENYDSNTNPKVSAPKNLPQKGKRRPATSDSSDNTSSSSSFQDIRRKDKHRSESCKTYNLIMGKLDELNHLFVARRASPAPAARAPARPPLSSGSVSVCDKKVATEDVKRINTPVIQVMHSSRVSNRFHSERGRCSNNKHLAVTHAPGVDIEPLEKQNGEGSIADNWSDSGCGAPLAFDLDDPLHLYAQAKRLQTLHARTRHGSERHSTQPSKHVGDDNGGNRGDNRDDKINSKTSMSICALCRGYWRVVGRFLKQQLFGISS